MRFLHMHANIILALRTEPYSYNRVGYCQRLSIGPSFKTNTLNISVS